MGFTNHTSLGCQQSLQTRVEVLVDPLGQPIPFSDIVGKGAADKTAEQHAAAQDYAFAWQAKGRYRGLPLDGRWSYGACFRWLQGESCAAGPYNAGRFSRVAVWQQMISVSAALPGSMV